MGSIMNVGNAAWTGKKREGWGQRIQSNYILLTSQLGSFVGSEIKALKRVNTVQ